MENNSKI